MRNGSDGFTLVETLFALFLIGIGVLALAPMFIFATQGTATGADYGEASAMAVERMELLRAQSWAALSPGGSVDSAVSGFSDLSDPDFEVRWSVTNNGTPLFSRTIVVRVLPARIAVGQQKEVTLTFLRGR